MGGCMIDVVFWDEAEIVLGEALLVCLCDVGELIYAGDKVSKVVLFIKSDKISSGLDSAILSLLCLF